MGLEPGAEGGAEWPWRGGCPPGRARRSFRVVSKSSASVESFLQVDNAWVPTCPSASALRSLGRRVPSLAAADPVFSGQAFPRGFGSAPWSPTAHPGNSQGRLLVCVPGNVRPVGGLRCPATGTAQCAGPGDPWQPEARLPLGGHRTWAWALRVPRRASGGVGGLPGGGRAWSGGSQRDPAAHLGGSTGQREHGGRCGRVGPLRGSPWERRSGRGRGGGVRGPGLSAEPTARRPCALVGPAPRLGPHCARLPPVVGAQHAARRAGGGAPDGGGLCAAG